MRTLSALALGALLFASTATASFADGGDGYAIPTAPQTERVSDGGDGYSQPVVNPSNESDFERWV